MAIQHTTRLCSLAAVVGKSEACPEGSCPFWEPGGAALGGRCGIEEFGIALDPALANWLLEIREELAAGGSEEQERVMRGVFHHLLNGSPE